MAAGAEPIECDGEATQIATGGVAVMDGFKDGFKAIVIVGQSGGIGQHRQASLSSPHSVAYAFNAFSSALAFVRRTKSQKVVVEFGVEIETLDFYDAMKALEVPVVFSANSLRPTDLPDFDIRVSNVIYGDQSLARKPAGVRIYRPAPEPEVHSPTSA